MKKTITVVCLLLLVLTACAPQQTPQQQAFLEELAHRPLTCTGEAECDAQWNRAIEWVSTHTVRGIQTISDNLIVTNKVQDGSQPTGKYPEFSVVRYKTGEHSYAMDFDSYCNHGFACNPSALKLRAGFVTSVMGPPPGVTVSEDGTKISKTVPSDGQ